MTPVEIIFIVIPIIAAMLIALLISFKLLRKEFYWAVIPLAAIAAIALLMTA